MSRKKREPWERQVKEPDAAWQAFKLYRDMPHESGTKRSQMKVAKRLGKNDNVIARWSIQWNWVERCNEYDTYMDDVEVEARVKAERKRVEQEQKMDERHVALAARMQTLLLNTIDTIKTEDLSPKGLADLTRALQTVATVERESRHSTTADRQLELAIKRYEHELEREAQVESEDGLLPDLIRELQDE